MLRAIHANPDDGAVRVNLRPDDPESDLKFVIPGFSNATDYFEVPASDYKPEVKIAGTSKDVELKVPDVPILPGKAYTAFAIGRTVNDTREVVLTVDSASGGTDNPEELLPDTGGPTPTIYPLLSFGYPLTVLFGPVPAKLPWETN